MKKKSQAIAFKIKCLSLWATTGLALSVFAPDAKATADLDRQFSLQSIGFLRAFDNVDGLFGDYVLVSYKDYFSKQSRFTVQDLAKAEGLLTDSKIPYQKLIEDYDVLAQLSRTMKVESLLRTKILKEGPKYRFQIDWLHPPRMDLIASETFFLEEPHGGQAFGVSDIKSAITSALDRLIAKVPFQAQVTGRDGSSVTVNMGNNTTIKRGDTLVIATLEDVKRHPLLRTVVDWKFSNTGKVQVEQVEEGIAFCKLVEEEPGRILARFQKITQVIAAPVASPITPQDIQTEDPAKAESERLAATPTLGYISAGLLLGGYSRQFSQQNGAVGNTGSGLFYGAKFDGELWFDRFWFADLAFGAGSASLSQKDIQTNTDVGTSLSATTFYGKIAAGYTFFTSPEFFGTKAWVRLGYQTLRFAMPIQQAPVSTGPTTFGGLFLGVGGDLPIRSDYGALLNLDFGFLNSGTQTGLSIGNSTGAAAISFFIGGYKQITPRMRIRGGLDIVTGSADYDQGATVTHRTITVAPSVVYYF